MKVLVKSNVTHRRMPITECFLVPDRLSHSAIQVQRGNRGAASRADADGANVVPAKVQAPRIASGIEQANFLSGFQIAGRQLCAFAQRAGHAGQSEIIESSLAIRVDGDDVINVEGRFLRGLREATVFTAILRALDNLTPKLRRDGHAVSGVRCSIVANADVAKKANQPIQPSLRLRVSRRSSGGRLGLACRANHEGASARPWAGETLPGRPASQLSVRWLETYSLSVSAAESSRSGALCPSLEFHSLRNNYL
jgi:hypothetical protein